MPLKACLDGALQTKTAILTLKNSVLFVNVNECIAVIDWAFYSGVICNKTETAQESSVL